MSYYSTGAADLQAVKTTNSDGISIEIYVDRASGKQVPRLDDPRFPWRERKKKTLGLADVYRDGKLGKYADRATVCATWLEYLATADGDMKQLHHFNACQLRLCPLCSARKAKIMARRLAKVIERMQADHPATQLIFLTLTVANCTGDKLRDTLDLLTKAWNKLLKRRGVVRAVKGTFRAIEITRNRLHDTYHPHIHAILVVENGYFARSNGLYLTKDTWIDMWQQSLQVPYKPSIDVRSTYVRGGNRGLKGGGTATEAAAAAVVEAAKYATKDSEYISDKLFRPEAAKVARVYTAALHKKRLTAMSGWVAEAAQQLALDLDAAGDLVHDEDGDGPLTEDTAALLMTYGFHFGVMDYTLEDARPNPNYQGGVADDD